MQFPQSQRKGMNILRSLLVKFVISAYEFKACSTVNYAKTNKSRNRSGINGDRFLTKRRRRKLLRGKGGRVRGYATWGNFHGILTPSHSDRVLARF